MIHWHIDIYVQGAKALFEVPAHKNKLDDLSDLLPELGRGIDRVVVAFAPSGFTLSMAVENTRADWAMHAALKGLALAMDKLGLPACPVSKVVVMEWTAFERELGKHPGDRGESGP
jgi:hypothetical protein